MTANINTTSEFSPAAKELCELLKDHYTRIQAINDAKARSDADDKKHPFLHLFKRASIDKQYYRANLDNLRVMERIRNEMSTLHRMANVIELSGLTNKPKAG